MSEVESACERCGAAAPQFWNGRYCWDCVERLCDAQEDVESRLVEMFGLSRRTVNAVVRQIPVTVILNGDGAPEGRAVQWIEQVHDSQIERGRNVGRKTINELRAAIPRRQSDSVICAHCGGSGKVNGRVVQLA